jgi:hypothetical protein
VRGATGCGFRVLSSWDWVPGAGFLLENENSNQNFRTQNAEPKMAAPGTQHVETSSAPLLLVHRARLAAAVVPAVGADAVWWLRLVAMGALAEADGRQ